MIEEYARFALSTVSHRKRRSWLTILGIFIGIAAVVGLVSISQGLKDAVESQFELIGADTITIMPGRFGHGTLGFGAEKLSEKDVKIVERVRGVDVVAPMLMRQTAVEYAGEERYIYVIGTPAEKIEDVLFNIGGMEIIQGRIPPETDKYGMVVGYLVPKDLYDRDVKIGSKLKIQNKEFKVRGVLSKVGNRRDDTRMYIHLDTAREIFNEPDEVSIIILNVKHGQNPEKVAEDITEKLKDYRGEEDFSVMTSTQLSEMVSNILSMIQLVLVGIATISLLVGGIGIMNTMYTSVQERTREIGIMKAIGATNEDILLIFLIESGLLGLVGGIIGCFLGTLLALGIEYAAVEYGLSILKASITLELIIFALGFSFILGMVSGVFPARQAAKMNPVEALRYE